MVIWVIGKSGSGKSFLAKNLIKQIKKIYKKKKILWIDGDDFRKKFSSDLGYSLLDRKKILKEFKIDAKLSKINHIWLFVQYYQYLRNIKKRTEAYLKIISRFILM